MKKTFIITIVVRFFPIFSVHLNTKTMKKLTLLVLALAFSTFSKAQDSQSEWINAADPTQLYTKVDFNAGLIASGSSGLNGPDQWIINLGGEYSIKKFNFGFNLPFSK